MDREDVFEALPAPATHSFPDYSLPKGDPVLPIAITADELETLFDLYDRFAAVDPTGIDDNPFLKASTEFLQQAFGAPAYRPDDQLKEDIAAMLNDFSDGLGGADIGVVDATPKHHQTLYFFLTTCKGYHLAPHLRFSPPGDGIETLYTVYQRVVGQDVYLKRPQTVFENG
ncbi:hypothetical protein [Halapricum desulfuricans]|uniref:Uncharacterized protein n=1 Tax=Halapricum desulfuricans TaxID=2841257 RepID=A0A897MZP2_9EURY|nr:hypothetical protein [Halapricum desulfuricans]QSG05914.1 Uncharacterized protein HSR121_1576 [Halapricum desulfuricans]